MKEIGTFIVTTTAWLSFLTALWLYVFDVTTWHAPSIMVLVVIVVYGLTAKTKNER